MTSVTANQSHKSSSLYRIPALLLTIQIVFWVAVVAMVFRFYPNVPPGPNDPWSAQRAGVLLIPWIAFHMVMVTAFACGTLGILLIAYRLIENHSRLVGGIGLGGALLSLLLAFIYLGLRLMTLRIDQPSLAMVPSFQASNVVAIVLTELTLIATIAVSLGLRQMHAINRSAIAVIVLCVLMMIAGLYAPPFVFGIIWLVLGITLMKNQKPQRVESQAAYPVK